MSLKLIPRDREFWLYHGAATALTGAISLATVFLWGKLEALYVASTVAWVLPFTAAVLGFRWLYRTRQWHALPMRRLIPVALAYGTIAGLLVVATVQATVLPFFWQDIADGHAAAGITLVPREYIVRRLIGDGLQSQVFISAWIFIYVTVTGNRRIKDGELTNLRLQNSLKEAQLSSLSNQLNPHFLFNALNNIRFMIHENPSQADATLVALSEMLRYSLESSRHEKVPLSQEVAIIDQYISIMKGQLEERLRFAMRIAPALQYCLIPPMIVQMLIENAIKHGIDELQEGGDVVIDAMESDDRMRITVSNDIPAAPGDAPGMGIGLRNIQRRLHLLYGERASLNVSQTASQFQVLLSLPKETA